MVLAYFPQRMKKSLGANSDYTPQGVGSVGALFDTMAYEDLDTMAYEPPNWLNAQFQKRIPLTINTGEVPSTQTDFPLLIIGTFPELIGKFTSELRFASTDDIQLEYEIDTFNTAFGTLIAWVKKPTVNDGDIIYIYFDNPLAVDEQNSGAVWSNNFVVVYHMSQPSGNILDSTVNNNDGTPINSPTNAAGPIGNAKNLFANDVSFSALDNNTLDTTDITVSAWIKISAVASIRVIASKEVNPLDDDWFFLILSGLLTVLLSNNSLISVGAVSLGVDHHVAFTIVGTNTLNMYIDGQLVHTQSITPKKTSSISSLLIGDDDGSSLRGIEDEFHMSNDGKSSDWIETEFNNQRPTSNTFYTIGTVESVPTVFDRMAYEIAP